MERVRDSGLGSHHLHDVHLAAKGPTPVDLHTDYAGTND